MTTLSPVKLSSAEAEKIITIDKCCWAAIEAFGVDRNHFYSRRKSNEYCHARFAAMWLAVTKTYCSFPQIGRAIGGRDHTTVMHGVKRAEALYDTDEQFGDRLQSAWIILHGGYPKKEAEE